MAVWRYPRFSSPVDIANAGTTITPLGPSCRYLHTVRGSGPIRSCCLRVCYRADRLFCREGRVSSGRKATSPSCLRFSAKASCNWCARSSNRSGTCSRSISSRIVASSEGNPDKRAMDVLLLRFTGVSPQLCSSRSKVCQFLTDLATAAPVGSAEPSVWPPRFLLMISKMNAFLRSLVAETFPGWLKRVRAGRLPRRDAHKESREGTAASKSSPEERGSSRTTNAR